MKKFLILLLAAVMPLAFTVQACASDAEKIICEYLIAKLAPYNFNERAAKSGVTYCNNAFLMRDDNGSVRYYIRERNFYPENISDRSSSKLPEPVKILTAKGADITKSSVGGLDVYVVDYGEGEGRGIISADKSSGIIYYYRKAE